MPASIVADPRRTHVPDKVNKSQSDYRHGRSSYRDAPGPGPGPGRPPRRTVRAFNSHRSLGWNIWRPPSFSYYRHHFHIIKCSARPVTILNSQPTATTYLFTITPPIARTPSHPFSYFFSSFPSCGVPTCKFIHREFSLSPVFVSLQTSFSDTLAFDVRSQYSWVLVLLLSLQYLLERDYDTVKRM